MGITASCQGPGLAPRHLTQAHRANPRRALTWAPRTACTQATTKTLSLVKGAAASCPSTDSRVRLSAECLSKRHCRVSGVQHGANARAKMAKPCPSRRGVLSVRMRSKATNGLTDLLYSYSMPICERTAPIRIATTIAPRAMTANWKATAAPPRTAAPPPTRNGSLLAKLTTPKIIANAPNTLVAIRTP